MTRKNPSHPTAQPISHGPTKEEWQQAHESIKADRELWSSLTSDGFQSNGRGGLIEHRRCPACRSSISRECTALEAVAILSQLASVHARSLEAITDAAAQAQGIPVGSPVTRRA